MAFDPALLQTFLAVLDAGRVSAAARASVTEFTFDGRFPPKKAAGSGWS